MKTYSRLKCSVCNRTIDKHINLTRYTPDLCTITQGCTGRLRQIEQRSNASIAAAPITGVTDWSPRNGYDVRAPVSFMPENKLVANNTNVIVQDADNINLETGTKQQIVFACKARGGTQLPPELTLSFSISSDEPQTYKSFIYRFPTGSVGIQNVSGKESGLEGKVLRYNATGSSPDQVEVRVNGVLRQQGIGEDEYQIYTGNTSSPAAPNAIHFNVPIQPVGVTQIDVIVFKTQEAKLASIKFRLQTDVIESRLGTGAYENVESVTRFEGANGETEYGLYVADLPDSGLKLNSIFVPNLVQADSMYIDFSKAFFLLASRPYIHVDRYYTVIAPFTEFSLSENKVIKYSFDRQLSKNTITISFGVLQSVYPPLVMNLMSPDELITKTLSGDPEQVTVDGGVIVGPDS